ncbi:hypothetical protein [Streptomyces fulvorobeus]|uniref:Uncharacterized protein n=1 Tax=Streptomyces fulvorobeus TaxID=284028 RepID=A0A7J0CG26_9ACTN|nr:hypothetical protein [Streptomyces fulvorobeus]NYE44220.1 hypothetical protein [Streptomyces fulvorobeus]GFN00735.1 hypothetical protein Sfulv_55450 [Streptomyces fulvorobeus]
MKHTQAIHTADGSTVTITRRGIEFDLETKSARGETISTVVMNSDDVRALLEDVDVDINGSAYDEGYRDGYDAERDEA